MSLSRYARFVGACAAVAIVAGCGASDFAASRSASPSHRAGPEVPKNLYVANFANDTVAVYQPGSGTPLRTIKDGVKAPVALAFDPSEYLYVADSASSTVTVYYPEDTKVTRTISDEVNKPQAIAFDSKGNITS
jgi:DNA-binding beta-propeller fold protein YncE